MTEFLGLASAAEIPAMIIDVQRCGPSTGLPTMVGQADMMQARWGSHGDYQLISMSPQSPQESFDLIIDAFNLSEVYRVPVMFMMDECVGHMTEKVVIPEADQLDVVPRKLTKLKPDKYLPYKVPKGEWVPEFARAGDGYRYHTTGLTHDEKGYPVMSAACQEMCVSRLREKIIQNADKIIRYDEEEIDGADVIVIAYGITARVTRMGIDMARKKGIKVGFIRLIVVWPFPEELIRKLSSKVNAFVVPEINYGQIVLEVERCAAGKTKAISVPHAGGGVHDPNVICKAIVGAAK
jgi:2-oxoglutarate ferredoxin oxidoreductase subunit alpha